jgi:DNA-binding PadR family transcriptional regulator/polyisoprenoid-binding protein YceI
MDEAIPTKVNEELRASRFELAPPRRFVLPAILLLLSEAPGHGYSLEKDLRELNFGKIDRPTVYRALAQLEKDGLVRSWSEAPTAGHERRVYGMTSLGERVLGVWMSVIKEERDLLGRVLRRYQATGAPDAMLAEVDGGWAAALGSGWSPVAPTSVAQRHLRPVGAGRIDSRYDDEILAVEPITVTAPTELPRSAAATRRFRLSPDRSVVLIEVRSTVGPISFGALGITGHIDAVVSDGVVDTGTRPSAHVEIAVDGLRSGNSLYDAELLRRIDARQFPLAELDLTECWASGAGGRFSLSGELTFHGVTRPAHGTVSVEVVADARLVARGEQVFDIRDFDVPSPTVLMLRIYPDVRVHLHVEADLEEG